MSKNAISCPENMVKHATLTKTYHNIIPHIPGLKDSTSATRKKNLKKYLFVGFTRL